MIKIFKKEKFKIKISENKLSMLNESISIILNFIFQLSNSSS